MTLWTSFSVYTVCATGDRGTHHSDPYQLHRRVFDEVISEDDTP
jgi:hypothetical protein